MTNTSRMKLAFWIALALAGCSDKDKKTDAGTDAGPDSGGTDEVAAIESALNDPEAAFTFEAEAEAFGDERVTALAERISEPPAVTETPNERGWVADPVDDLGPIKALRESRSHDFHLVRLAFAGTGEEPLPVEGTLTASAGAVLARRIWEAEDGDEFAERGVPLAAGAKTRSFTLSVSSTDTDKLMALVIADETPTLTLTVGDADIPIDLSGSDPNDITYEIDEGPVVTVSVIENPRGPCLVTESVLEGEGRMGSAGPIAIIRGALERDGHHVGFLRGFFGRSPQSGQDVLVFKAIDLAGGPLSIGILHGPLGFAPRVGGLRNASEGIGSFHARGAVGIQTEEDGVDPNVIVNLSIRLHTECRAE